MSGGGTAGGRIAPGVGANLIGQHAQDRNQDATVYIGNLDVQAIFSLLWGCIQLLPLRFLVSRSQEISICVVLRISEEPHK